MLLLIKQVYKIKKQQQHITYNTHILYTTPFINTYTIYNLSRAFSQYATIYNMFLSISCKYKRNLHFV